MNIEIANRLLQYRKKHNLSQEELASQIGVSRQAVSKWERAEASPDTDNLILLAKDLNISTLFLEVNEQNKPAIHLYEKLGFEKLGVRKKYYNNNNGIIMKKNLK